MARNRSKRKLRDEAVCLNCGTVLNGRYCHQCGQENIEQKQPIGRVILDFLDGFTYFDSKFFKTVKPFILKPGFLVKEYNSGKRNTYLSPVKMYFFLSFLYFLLQFGFNKNQEVDVIRVEIPKDSTETVTQRRESIFSLVYDSTVTLHRYDSTQLSMPPNERDGYIRSLFLRRYLHTLDKWSDNPEILTEELNRKFNSSVPQIVFLLMPLVALLLKLFYLRRKIYLIDHLVFSLNLHCFVFLLLIFITFLQMWFLQNESIIVSLIAYTALFIYIYKAFQMVYGGKWWLTTIKVVSISVIYTFLLGIGIVLNAFWTLVSF